MFPRRLPKHVIWFLSAPSNLAPGYTLLWTSPVESQSKPGQVKVSKGQSQP